MYDLVPRVRDAWNCENYYDNPFISNLNPGDSYVYESDIISSDGFSTCDIQPIWFSMGAYGKHPDLSPSEWPITSDYLAISFREEVISIDGGISTGFTIS